MPQGWRPIHPGEPTPEWGPFGRTGCIVFVTVVITIMVIALLIGATRTSREAEANAHGGATFAGTVLLIPVAFKLDPLVEARRMGARDAASPRSPPGRSRSIPSDRSSS